MKKSINFNWNSNSIFFLFISFILFAQECNCSRTSKSNQDNFIFYITKDGLELSGNGRDIKSLTHQSSKSSFTDFSNLQNHRLSSTLLTDNVKEESIISPTRTSIQSVQTGENSIRKPVNSFTPKPSIKYSESYPIFGSRLSNRNLTSSRVNETKSISISSAPRSKFDWNHFKTIFTSKPTTTTSTTTTTTTPGTPVDDEFDIDYIDNVDDSLVNVTHLNQSSIQDDLWNAESKTTINKTQPILNETKFLISESQLSEAKFPPEGLNLNTKSDSKPIDFDSIFSSYKSPELPFDPFKAYEEENGIVSDNREIIKTTYVNNNGESFEYIPNNDDGKNNIIQYENVPQQQSQSSSEEKNTLKTFEYVTDLNEPTKSTINVDNITPAFIPYSNEQLLPSTTPIPLITTSTANNNLFSRQPAQEQQSYSSIDDKRQVSPITQSASTSNTLPPSTLINNLGTFDLKTAYENLRSVRKEYANPIESEVKSNVGSINSINQHDTFRPNLESTFVSTTGPIGTLLNRATSLEPYSGYPSSSSSSSTEQSSLSSSSSSSSNKGNDFFTNHKLSEDFYLPRSIPKKYISLQSNSGSLEYGQRKTPNTLTSSNADAKWKGIYNNVPKSRITETNPSYKAQQINPTTNVGISENDKQISRLVPQASVETIPLPRPDEYDEPDVIHSGNYVVRVENVALKDQQDSYYNPEIPGETNRPSSTNNNFIGLTNGKSARTRSRNSANIARRKNGKSKRRKSKRRKVSGQQKRRKNSKQEDDSQQEIPVIDDVIDNTANAVDGIASNLPGTDTVSNMTMSESDDDEDTETEKEESTTTTAKPIDDVEEEEEDGTEEGADEESETETSTEKPADEAEEEEGTGEEGESNGNGDEESTDDSTDEATNGDTDTSNEDDDSSSSNGDSSDSSTTEKPEEVTTTTAKPKPAYPPFPPFPYPFPPPFFFPPPPPYMNNGAPYPYPPPPHMPGGYPPFPPPPPMPYGPQMYRPGHGQMANRPYYGPPKYGQPTVDNNYKPPVGYQPPPPMANYQPKPVSYTYTNTPPPPPNPVNPTYPPPPQPSNPMNPMNPNYPPPPPPLQHTPYPTGSSYQPPPPPSPPPPYQPNNIPSNYGSGKYNSPQYSQQSNGYQRPKGEGYYDKGGYDQGYGGVEPKVEFNTGIEKTISISPMPQYEKKQYYPKPPKMNNYYQNPQYNNNYNYRRQDMPYSKPMDQQHSPPPPPSEVNDNYYPTESPNRPPPYSSYSNKAPVKEDIISADISLVSMKTENGYDPKYAKNAIKITMAPKSNYQRPPPPPMQQQSYGSDWYQPNQPEYGNDQNMNHGMNNLDSETPSTQKATYFQRFKDGMKRLIPKLRYSSGDPFPPQLDEYYRPLMAATNPHDTKWNHMTMGDSTIEDQHKKSSSIIYNCDQNRVGKCVLPEASLTTPPQPISSSNYQSVYKKK